MAAKEGVLHHRIIRTAFIRCVIQIDNKDGENSRHNRLIPIRKPNPKMPSDRPPDS